MALVTKEFKLDLAPGKLRPVVNASQGDIGRPFMARCYWDGSPWTATGYTANIRGRKPDGTVFDYTTTVDGSTVTFETTEQMTIISGPVECELVFSNDGDIIASANFVLMVEDSPYNPDAPSESVVPGIEDLIEQTIGGDVSDEVDAWLDAHPEATTTVQDGAITKAKINTAFLPEIENAYVTPEMFGAVGDGTTDDTSAFVTACQQGKPVYVKNSKIGTCSIEGVEVHAGNIILTGNLSIKDVDLHGHLSVDGGGIVVNRTDNVDAKEKSVLHDLKVNIVDCDTLLTVSGKQFNLKCYSWTVNGKCNDEVIKLATSAWITYTIFENMALGTSDRAILINDTSSGHHGIADIHIKNVYNQRSGVTHSDCRFVETNSLGALYLDGSFMYDLAAGDSQVYIDRTNTGSVKFNITYTNTSLIIENDSFAHDSNGAKGLSLTADIANVPYNANGFELVPTPLRKDTPFYSNAANFYGSGHLAVETAANVAGVKMKIGGALKAKSPEKMIGVNYNDDTLTVLTRDKDNQTWTSKTYINKEKAHYADNKAQIDAYGMGWPVFYTPSHKVVVRYGANYYDAMGNNITSSIT